VSQPLRISRRAVLRGVGTAVALPLLEAMRPLRTLAGSGVRAAPVRMAFLYVPNGMHMPDWGRPRSDLSARCHRL
jgi:hypothetical protein